MKKFTVKYYNIYNYIRVLQLYSYLINLICNLQINRYHTSSHSDGPSIENSQVLKIGTNKILFTFNIINN